MKRCGLGLSGFSLVELLIVIVVISTLSAISVVAYNGVTKRAEATAQDAIIVQWLKQIDFKIAQGATFSTGYSCLGKAADYPETSEFKAGQCWSEEYREPNGYSYPGDVFYDAAALGPLADSGSMSAAHRTADQTKSDDPNYTNRTTARGPYVRFYGIPSNNPVASSVYLRWVPINKGQCVVGKIAEFSAMCQVYRSLR